jgi:tetratricopeptide (TPR) repeat protein
LAGCFAFLALISFTPSCGADVLDGAAFKADPAELQREAAAVPAEKEADITLLLNDNHFQFDERGALTESRHKIYRVENQRGVEDWDEVSAHWEAWHQFKPEIKARVITTDGAVHWLDDTTLNDVPVHEDAPKIYSDERTYGGPLPAIAPGAIIEEQTVVRDVTPLFAAGTAHRRSLAWNVGVSKTRLVIVHPVSLPLRYETHLLPGAKITKSTADGAETITLEQGPIPGYPDTTEDVPSDVVLYPTIEFSTGTSWQAVAAEYQKVSEAKIRTADVQALIQKAAITGKSRAATLRSLTALVHKNVRYTGVEFGESSLIPQYPSETLKRHYGDCKDKAAFLVALLRSAGIPAQLALVDAGPGLNINEKLPGMGMFDHAIVYVPASGADEELWIDATAQFSRVGTLPWMDYGRLALVVSDKTEALRMLPRLTPATNVHREFREFTLAEYGPAKITETDNGVGPEEADYREYYSTDSKEVRENGEKYVKTVYLSKSLLSLEHNDLSDLEKPASVKFVTEGRRGSTDLISSVVAIRIEGLFNSLSSYFRTKVDEESEPSSPSEASKHKTRAVDWQVTPFTSEWTYRITAPQGFKLRALPPDKSQKFGNLELSQKYSAQQDGTVVEAVLRLEEPDTRLTVQQASQLRDAVVKAREGDAILISFDQVGSALISKGNVKEGLAAYRQLAHDHPKEALHQVQLANALLAAGLGEEARKMALGATKLEPSSALAFSTLGLTLKNDLVGRLGKKGMDFEGAVAAYRKAIALDPRDKETRANLALLLENDADGIRYSETARLKDAVAELLELKKLDAEYSKTYDDNVLFDLWYAGDYQGVLDYAAGLPANDTRKGLTLAALASEKGTEAAIKKSVEITTDDQSRGRVLVSAGMLSVRVGKYQQAAALVSAGAQGDAAQGQFARSAEMFRKTKPFEEIKIPVSDPRSVVQALYHDLLRGELQLDRLKSMLATDVPGLPDLPGDVEFRTTMAQMKSQMRAAGLPLKTVSDIAIANLRYTVNGDDSKGYKVTVEPVGAPASDLYVVKEDNEYKIATFSMSDAGTSLPEGLAPFALREVQKNNLQAARVWLDRARDKIHIAGTDDPLAGQPFPYFWTTGQEADAETIRAAALVLLPSKSLQGPYLAALLQFRNSAKDDLTRNRLTMVLAYGYESQSRWSEVMPVAEELMKAVPESVRAFELAAKAYAGLHRFDEWEKELEVRMGAHPTENAYVRSAALLAAYRGRYDLARQTIKKLIDKGQASENDMNQFAWFALYLPPPIDPETLEVARRASDLTKNNNFGILHTLACVDAAAGKTTEARELLLKTMNSAYLDEPNSQIWFGFGLIAEQYGDMEAARAIYARVEKPKTENPGDTRKLVELRLATLGTATANGSSVRIK